MGKRRIPYSRPYVKAQELLIRVSILCLIQVVINQGPHWRQQWTHAETGHHRFGMIVVVANNMKGETGREPLVNSHSFPKREWRIDIFGYAKALTATGSG